MSTVFSVYNTFVVNFFLDVPKLLDETISIDNTPLEMLYFFPDVGELTKKQYQAFAKASIQAGI